MWSPTQWRNAGQSTAGWTDGRSHELSGVTGETASPLSLQTHFNARWGKKPQRLEDAFYRLFFKKGKKRYRLAATERWGHRLEGRRLCFKKKPTARFFYSDAVDGVCRSSYSRQRSRCALRVNWRSRCGRRGAGATIASVGTEERLLLTTEITAKLYF